MSQVKAPYYIAVLMIFLVTMVFLLSFSYNSGQQFHPKAFTKKLFLNVSGPDKSTAFCKLPTNDPWDESLTGVLTFDPLYGYQSHCNKYNLRTKLENSMLLTVENDDHCWGRCLIRERSMKYRQEEWQNGTSVFKCDIIEVRCSRTPDIDDFDYNWVHTQIFEIEEVKNKSKPTSDHAYDVLLLILDSTSSSQSNRNLPKTINYLTKSLQGVEFPYLNRVASNSKPNAFALFLGKVCEGINRDVFDLPSIPSNLNIEEVCRKKLDDFTFLQDDFSNEGYVTSFFEDWFTGLYDFENCFGFQRSPTTHTNVPFRELWSHADQQFTEMKTNNNCTSKHQIIFDHIAQFVKSYPGIPKFTTLWDTDVGHDNQSSSIQADTIIYDFLIKSRKNLERSFIFIMGDHGFRYGTGFFEMNNPMLIVAPPRELTKNVELMRTLRENSQKLQTHHDTRHTLLDILKHQPGSGYLDRNPVRTDGLGSSYLRTQPGERSCRTLPIPLEYCICSQDKQIINRDSIAKKLGDFTALSINNQLRNMNISEYCREWKFEKMVQLHKIEASDDVDVYMIVASLDPKADVKTIVRDYRNGNMSVGTVDRTDIFGKRGDCIKEASYRRICDCIANKQ